MRVGRAAKSLVTGLHEFHIQNLDSRNQFSEVVFPTQIFRSRFLSSEKQNLETVFSIWFLHPRKVNPEKQNLESVFRLVEKHNRFLVFRNRFSEVVF